MRTRSVWAAAAVGLASLAVSAWSIARFSEGGVTFEFCQYAEIGRNLLEGRGYRTAEVSPYVLAYLDERGIPFDAAHPAPVLDRFPLQSLLTAAAEALLGRRDAAVLALSALILAACAAATVLVGSLFFSGGEAVLAGLLVALDPSFQRGFVLWGLPDFGFLLTTLLATAALCLAVPAAGKPSNPRRWLAAGALAGLAWLSRSNLILWLPVFAVLPLRLRARERAAALGAWAAGFALVSAPGWLYFLRWCGSVNPPTFAWDLAHHVTQDTPPWLDYRVTAVSEVLGRLPALGLKFRSLLVRYLSDLPTMWQMRLLFPLACVGAGYLFLEDRTSADPGRGARRWILLNAAMLSVQIPAFSLLRYDQIANVFTGRYLLWFAPAAFLLAARGAERLGAAYGRPRAGLVVLALANLLFFGPDLVRPRERTQHPLRLPVAEWPEIRAAAELPESGLVVTNLPTQVAWYARRPAVMLPSSPDELEAIARRHELAGVLITRLWIGELYQTPRWRTVLLDPAAQRELWRRLGLRVRKDFGTSLLLEPAGT
jgi:4-amino-4-deoxy-L-arabinose transferase-like glycosyltransferase